MSTPFFGDFGKSVSDLLSKKFDFYHSLSTKSSEDNVKMESGVKCGKSNDGYSKFTYKDSRFGSVEGEVHTAAADSKTSGKLKFNKLSKGLDVTLGGTAKPDGNLKIKYSQKNFNGEASVNSDLSSAVVQGSVVAGFEGVAVGGKASLEVSSEGANLKAVDAGIQYSHGRSITASVFSSKNMKKFTGSVFYRVNGDLDTGVSASMEGSNQSVDLGAQYSIDSSTTLKAKVGSDKKFSTSVEHRLANPHLAINLASQFDLGSGNLKANKWGVGFTFGSN